MEQTKEPASKTVSQRDRTFGLINKSRVIDLQFPQSRLQMLKIGGVDRVNTAEHHRMNLLKPGQRFESRVSLVGQSVSNFDLSRRLDVGDEITDVTCLELGLGQRFRGKDANLFNFVVIRGPHQLNGLTRHQAARENSRVSDDSSIDIEYRIKNQCSQFSVRQWNWRRDPMDNGFEYVLYSKTRLGTGEDRLTRRDGQNIFQLFFDRRNVGV